MGFKLNMDRLSKAELIYLIKVRNPTAPTDVKATELRTVLRALLADESSSKITSHPDYPYTFAEDYDAVTTIKTDLTTLIEEQKLEPDKNRSQVIETKFSYGLERIERSVPSADDDSTKKEKLFTELAVMLSRYEIFAKPSYTVAAISDPAVVTTSVTTTTTTVTSVTSPPLISQISNLCIKPVPVAKWNLHFSGEPKGLSLSAFLERVNELMRARNMSREQLFAEACDLFAGKALVWFRANVFSVKTWDELVALLRSEFQPINYDERLFEEIKRRTQGADESIGMYVAVMKNMFARLSESLPEDKQLRILLRNMSPFYQTQLGLTEVNSVNELIAYGRRIEERRYAVENFVPPSRRKGDLEIDLAYVDTASVSSEISVVSNPRDIAVATVASQRTVTPLNASSSKLNASTPTCWNCGEPNHRAGNCPKPRTKLYCFRCGKPDVTVRSCSKCGTKRLPSGNAPRRH